MFADDAPKTDPWNEDRLGYQPFAERLANVIRAIDAPNGYVIGLHGEWGSGKSTALNFIRAILSATSKEEVNQIQVVEFRPWIVSGHQDLVGAFFKNLAEAVTPENLKRQNFRRRASKFARTAADPVADAAAKLGVVIDPSGGLASGAILGSGLIQTQKATIAASMTADRKLAASLS